MNIFLIWIIVMLYSCWSTTLFLKFYVLCVFGPNYHCLTVIVILFNSCRNITLFVHYICASLDHVIRFKQHENFKVKVIIWTKFSTVLPLLTNVHVSYWIDFNEFWSEVFKNHCNSNLFMASQWLLKLGHGDLEMQISYRVYFSETNDGEKNLIWHLVSLGSLAY